MEDTNNGRLKMKIPLPYLKTFFENLGKLLSVFKCTETDGGGVLDDTSPNSSLFTPKLLHEQVVYVHQMT